MAAGILAMPGTDAGPCLDPCGHRDCGETRFIAEFMCRFCKTSIGYERRFYLDPEPCQATRDHRGWVHASCLERSVLS